jgi:hypothetical protein
MRLWICLLLALLGAALTQAVARCQSLHAAAWAVGDSLRLGAAVARQEGRPATVRAEIDGGLNVQVWCGGRQISRRSIAEGILVTSPAGGTVFGPDGRPAAGHFWLVMEAGLGFAYVIETDGRTVPRPPPLLSLLKGLPGWP